MSSKWILIVLCTAWVLSCGPVEGMLLGSGGGDQPPVLTRGTITIREHSSISRPDPEGEDRTTVEHLVTIELVDGRPTASISYVVTRHAQSHMDNGIIIGDSSLDETTRAEGKSVPVKMQVTGGDDHGAYVFFFSVPGIKGTWTHDSQGSFRCVIPSRACGNLPNENEHRSADVDDLGGTSVEITLNPREPRSFSGTSTEIVDETNGLDRKITWDLQRR